MKTKALLGTLAVAGLLAVRADAQVTVVSVVTNGLAEPYNVAVDIDNNFYISDSVNNRIVRIDVNSGAASTLAGLPNDAAGSNDGPAYLAHFNNPQGLLFVSGIINRAVTNNYTFTNTIDYSVITNNLAGWINGDIVTITNVASTTNVTFTTNGLLITTNTTVIINIQVSSTDVLNGLVVTDSGNNLIRFVRLHDGWVTTLAGQAGIAGPAVNTAGASATFRYPLGLGADSSGNIYIADSLNNTLRVINLNDPTFGVTNVVISGTTFRQPNAVVIGDTNQIWVADTGNQSVKLITLTSTTNGSLTTYMGSNNRLISGTTDSTYGPSALFNGPRGLLWVSGAGLLIADTGNQIVRLATNNPNFGPTNYAVSTFAGTPGQSGLVDGAASSARFNWPIGLARDTIGNGFLVADLANNALRRIQTGPPVPPVAAPQIGWVDFQKDSFGDLVSILRTDQPFAFNNDVKIEILAEQGTQTHFTSGTTPPSPLEDTIPAPSRTVGTTPPAYRNGLHVNEVPFSMVTAMPDLTIKALGYQDGRLNSPVVQARFQFITADPTIFGDNAASFTVTNQTLGSTMWYTTNGVDPTNITSSTNFGPIFSPNTFSFNIGNSDLTFKIRAFRDSYRQSEVVTKVFSAANFVPNRISFGFAGGEASSDFQASPGQFFYAPITLSLIPNTTMYSLQFNVTVTNSPTTNGAGPAVEPGALGFSSMLMQKVLPGVGDHLPPGSGQWYDTIPPAMFVGFTTNIIGTNFFGVPVFQNLLVTNSSINLLGVGWLERFGFAFLYDTTIQDLISFSIAHDTLFTKASGKVVVGAYTFKVPTNASIGDQYSIQLGRPSATADGVGSPGSDVFIQTPTNATIVTVNPRSYIAGDVYPFRWFNAGDFGKGCLDNADVMQVFQTAIYAMDPPPPLSDFNAAMDSCCATGVTNGSVVFQQGGASVFDISIFDGDNTTINNYPFGDGQLDVTDVFVTYRRSLDPTLTWWNRFWTTNGLAAQTSPNVPCHTNATSAAVQEFSAAAVSKASNQSASSEPPSVTFTAGDALASAGQTLQIPITAQIHGTYPIRVLGLNLTVQPLDGSPALTQPIQFTPAAGLGQPYTSASRNAANYTAVWLDSTVPGVSGTAVVGTVTITLPANATSSAAYAIHFDHVSASPNGIASFPKQAKTGLITLSVRSTSSFNDAIPDSWRLRYFGTVNNLLSQANADADGDGMNNWQEYIAGTDPLDAKSNLRASTDQSAALQAHDCVIRWPSVAGKQYVIERSATLFAPNWIPVSTNTGSGTDMELHDATGGGTRFYRVHVLP